MKKPNDRLKILSNTQEDPLLSDSLDIKIPDKEMHIMHSDEGPVNEGCETETVGSCSCHSVCTCVPVSSCSCDMVCTCDQVCATDNCSCHPFSGCPTHTCSCNPVCTCDNVCTCQDYCTTCACLTIHYWYPT